MLYIYIIFVLGKTEAVSSPKPDSDEDKSGGSGPSNADSPGIGPKVPPLKIVIPTTDADTGARTNGKNGNRSHHHTALPYVVPSEESPPASNQPNSPKSPQKATTDNITVEEQKSPQTRVLRSSNRCGSNSSGAPSRGTSPIVPEEQLVQITSPAAPAVDVGSTNASPAIRSEQTDNVLAPISSEEKQTVITAASIAATASESVTTAELSGMELHPRRRKLKASRTESETSDTSSAANVTTVETNPPSTTNEPVPVTNCYQMFLNIRKQVNILKVIFDVLVLKCDIFYRLIKGVRICFLYNQNHHRDSKTTS